MLSHAGGFVEGTDGGGRTMVRPYKWVIARVVGSSEGFAVFVVVGIGEDAEV